MRPSWDEYFMDIARHVASRSTCLRRHVGAIVVKNRRILSTGYNGAPTGLPHCDETGCLREELGIPSGERQEICRGLHAEQNAIVQAALHGAAIEGGSIYCTDQPSITCEKMIFNTGILRVVCAEDYPDGFVRPMMEAAGIELLLRRQASRADAGPPGEDT